MAKNYTRRAHGTEKGSLFVAALAMKTFNNIFPEIISFDMLHYAYIEARRGKRSTGSCVRFERRLEQNLIELQNQLIHGTYKPDGYRTFLVHEPKTRSISALTSFKDRVLQHAIVAAIQPIWEARFISDSYACRPGKGTHAGANRVQAMLRACLHKHGSVYALKADVRRYFASIRHDRLKGLLRRKIADRRVLHLLDMIIDSYSEAGSPGVGIPIGNLTSQLFANIYLDSLDQHIKCRMREKWYVRYMDDFVVIHPDKRHLHALRISASVWLHQNLGLELNDKTQVFPVSGTNGRGLDFLGYHLWPYRRRLRKSSLKRFKRRVRRLRREYAQGHITLPEIKRQLSSYLTHAKHGEAQAAVGKFLDDNPFVRSANDGH